jgi:hypothetical protein
MNYADANSSADLLLASKREGRLTASDAVRQLSGLIIEIRRDGDLKVRVWILPQLEAHLAILRAREVPGAT